VLGIVVDRSPAGKCASMASWDVPSCVAGSGCLGPATVVGLSLWLISWASLASIEAISEWRVKIPIQLLAASKVKTGYAKANHEFCPQGQSPQRRRERRNNTCQTKGKNGQWPIEPVLVRELKALSEHQTAQALWAQG
jgi:hypothetical protein